MELNVATAAKPVKIPGPDHPKRSNAIPLGSSSRSRGGWSPTREKRSLYAKPPIPRFNTSRAKTSIWRSSTSRTTPLIALTKAIAAISASRSAASVRSTPCGVTRLPTPPSRRSRIISPFTSIASTRSRNGQRPKSLLLELSGASLRRPPEIADNAPCRCRREGCAARGAGANQSSKGLRPWTDG